MSNPITNLPQQIAVNPESPQDTNWLGRRIRNCSECFYNCLKALIQKIYDAAVRLFVGDIPEPILIPVEAKTADKFYEGDHEGD